MITTKIRTLIEIDRGVWSQTKAFATSEGYSLPEALKLLLTEILSKKGYKIPNSSQLVLRKSENNGDN